MIQVVPAIIPKSFKDLVKQTSQVKDYVELVQIDVMDGKFTPEPSWPHKKNNDPDFEKLVRHEGGFEYWEDLAFEVDMMVEKPENYVHDWICAGASALIVHLGSTEKIQDIINMAEEKHVGIGLAIRPDTPNEALDEWINHIQFVQFMGNQKIGYHGVELDTRVLEKISDFRRHHSDAVIAVDIGVTMITAPKLVQAGANKLASGSTIFNSKDVADIIYKMQQVDE